MKHFFYKAVLFVFSVWPVGLYHLLYKYLLPSDFWEKFVFIATGIFIFLPIQFLMISIMVYAIILINEME